MNRAREKTFLLSDIVAIVEKRIIVLPMPYVSVYPHALAIFPSYKELYFY